MASAIAKLFKNGQSQAVRLPKEFRFKGQEVYIQKIGDKIILTDKKTSWESFFKSESAFGDDYLTDRENELPQEREYF